jgi:hypothetical protein
MNATLHRSRLIRNTSIPAMAAASLLLAAVAGATPALAVAPAIPHWKLEARPAPTNLPLEGEGMIITTASNAGDAELDGETQTVTLTDTLPAGVEVTGVIGRKAGSRRSSEHSNIGVTCTKAPVNPVVCTYDKTLPPFEQIEILISVKTHFTHAAEPENEATVSGGGANTPNPLLTKLKINGEPTEFGVESYELTPENDKFEPEVQAGSHPFQLSTTFNLNQSFTLQANQVVPLPTAPAIQKNLTFKLPPGLLGNANVLGNPNAVQQCADVAFGAGDAGNINSCPENTVVGVAAVTFNDPIVLFNKTFVVPVFNLVPAPGEPARFGFEVTHVPIILDTSVRTGEDYGATVTVKEAPQTVQVLGSRVTFWGTPGDPRHDSARGWECLGDGGWVEGLGRPCEPLGIAKPAPLLLLPTSCGPLESTAEGEAWNAGELAAKGEASTFYTKYTSPPADALTGCEGLPFDPTIAVNPEKKSASTPTGMEVQVKMPQETTLNAEENAEADIKSTTLELPEGLQSSAGAANGLAACGVAETGFLGSNGDSGGTLENELEQQRFTPAAATCPGASKIGTVNVKTPLLEKELTGSVYLGEQDTNPFASPLVLYIVAEEEQSKVLVKLAGEVEINPTTGQLISKFKNTPQTPFETLTLHLTSGERASQATPAHCGEYTATAKFTDWSSSEETQRQSKFQITSGPNGTECPGANLPFGPSFAGGSGNTQAGAYTPFSVTIGRPDGNQALETIETELPAGVAALISEVTPCTEEQVNEKPEGNCPAASEVGHTTSESGLGGAPVTLGGKLYLTGPLKATSGHGASPFGLLAVTHAAAGPFDLGYVKVLSTINVNENTAQALVKSEPIPKILKGVPVQLKAIDVTVERPGGGHFQFNPTNCEELKITGKLTGYEGGGSPISYPFHASNCAGLPFAPKLTASVLGAGSKANGTTFNVTVQSAGVGQANIHKVDLTLPEVLPSRLTTIQKACLEAVFNANPAACDEGSVIGEGVVHTPVFKNPLRGPAYLVSHGNASFPDVEFVLQGEGVKLVLDGKTDIKKGITYSKFETSPDAPFTTFESIFPAGPHSALTSFVPENEAFSLCKQAKKLVMPTTIVGQNGATINQTTKIALVGCGGVGAYVRTAAKIKKHSVKGSTLTLVVVVPSGGHIKVSGSGLHTFKKSVSKAGDYKLKIKLGPKGTAAVASKHLLKTRVHLSFAPTYGNTSSAGVTVKFT